MKINTWEQANYEENLRKLREKLGPDYKYKRWHADIDGPWYDDSNPSGHGDTETEAIENALKVLEEMYAVIGVFLREKGRIP